MPLVKIVTNAAAPASKDAEAAVAMEISNVVGSALEKPAQWMSVSVQFGACMVMSGTTAPAAQVFVMSIGQIDATRNSAVTKALCAVLSSKLQIDATRIYVTFTDVPAANWGWNNAVFSEIL
jgi:phenylpyruvate tautomerase PptA (4-oxalocrotonate tautomerase family)